MTAFVPAGDDPSKTAAELLAKADKAGLPVESVEYTTYPEVGFNVPDEIAAPKRAPKKADDSE